MTGAILGGGPENRAFLDCGERRLSGGAFRWRGLDAPDCLIAPLAPTISQRPLPEMA